MKRFLLILFCIVCMTSILFRVDLSHAKVYIDITSPVLRQFPIAMFDFAEDEIGKELTEIVRDDLEFTGLFYFVSREAFMEDKEDDINPVNWLPIGVEAVLKGDIRISDKIDVLIRLYDVVESEVIIFKQYSSEKDSLRSLAHTISDDIYFELTGQRSFFRSRIVYVADRGNLKELMVMDYDGGSAQRVNFKKQMMLSPHVSSDGSKVIVSASGGRQWAIYLVDFRNMASRKVYWSRGVNVAGGFFTGKDTFVLSSSRTGSPNIYIMDLTTNDLKRLTSSYWIDISPAPSPDGMKIAFVSNRSGNPHIYVMDANGYNIQRVTYEGKYNTSPSWSPGGDLLAFTGMVQGGGNQIFVVRPDGTELTQLTYEGNNEDPTFSPDGRFITFTSDRKGRKTIYIMRIGGDRQKRISPKGYGAFGPAWLHNYREVQ